MVDRVQQSQQSDGGCRGVCAASLQRGQLDESTVVALASANQLGNSLLVVFQFDADQLPAGNVRVATVHTMVSGGAEPRFDPQLTAVATVDGRVIDATVLIEKVGAK